MINILNLTVDITTIRSFDKKNMNNVLFAPIISVIIDFNIKKKIKKKDNKKINKKDNKKINKKNKANLTIIIPKYKNSDIYSKEPIEPMLENKEYQKLKLKWNV